MTEKEKYGFVYIWYDRKRKMYYIGSHWGTEDDGYICSSNRMRDAYRRRTSDFKRRILSRVYERENLLNEEQKWLEKASKNKNRYYNMNFDVLNPWWHDEERRKTVIEKMSNSLKERIAKMSPEERSEVFGGHHKGKTSLRKGKTLEEIFCEEKAKELREKARLANLGKKKPEHSKLMKGRTPWNKGKTGIYSEETRAKMGWSRGKKLGSIHLEETKKKISEKNRINMKNLWQNDEYRKRMSEAHEGKPIAVETRKKISMALTGIDRSGSIEKYRQANLGEKNPNYGKSWYNNGIVSKLFKKDEVPEGFIKGRIINKLD